MKPKAKVSIGSKSREPKWKPNLISERERIYMREVKKLKPEVIFGLLQTMLEGQEMRNKSNSDIEEMMTEIKKKFLSKNYESIFTIIR